MENELYIKNGVNKPFFQSRKDQKESIKILFICHGNICRSPMAEFIFKDIVQKEGVASHFVIASAATSTEEIWGGVGNPVYPPARKVLAKHGLSCDGKYAVQLTAEDYDRYDYLIGMDDANIRNMERMTGHSAVEGKIYKLLTFAGETRDVSDPWYTRDFEQAYRDIYTGCVAFYEDLRASGRI